jgi:type II secretory pathway component GspD/PulD (secretin)
MRHTTQQPANFVLLLALLVLLVGSPRPAILQAQESAPDEAVEVDAEAPAPLPDPLVGVLADILAGAESERLELTDANRDKLTVLVGQRREQGASYIETMTELPQAEKLIKIHAFQSESLRLAMEILNVEQRSVVQQMNLRQQGLISIAEPQIARTLGLTEDQEKAVGQLIMAAISQPPAEKLEEQRARRTALDTELDELLSENQRAVWTQMIGVELVAADDADPEPADEPPAAIRTADGDIKLRFSFRFTPWEDVINWFVEQAELSLQMDGPPPGTFNYTDTRFYTPAEALDLMNGILLTRGYTLVRRRQLLTLVNLEDTIPDVLVEFVPLDELDSRGEYELVKTLFQLVKMTPEEAQADLQKLIGAQGSIMIFPAAKQVLVQETAGRLRTLRTIIESVEKPRQLGESTITELELKYVPAEDILVVARVMLGLGDEDNRAEGISFGIDPLGARIFVTGDEEKVALIKDLVTRMDKDPLDGAVAAEPGETPQLQTHSIQVADPTTAFEVLQTMLAGLPDIRMALDPSTNKIIAFARPSEQATIRAVIGELEGEVPQFEVISLKTLEPSMALAMIGNMFGGDPEAETSDGPKVTADPVTMKLFVRATNAEMVAIKEMIARLEAENTATTGGNIRLIPWSGDSAIEAVDRAGRFWQGGNRIRIITPSDRNGSNLDLRRTNDDPQGEPAGNEAPAATPPPGPQTSAPAARPLTSTDGSGSNVATLQFTSETTTAVEQSAAAAQPATGTGSDIIVEVTPDGILLISEDLDALDRFETLLRTLMPPSAGISDRRITIFYLKFAKADVASQLVQQILSGGESSSGDLGSLVGDITSGLMGGGGGLMGMLLGGGGGASEDATGSTFEASGTVSIVSDPRLNALVVQANEEDLSMITDLLDVIDKEHSEADVQMQGKPRLIPVIYTSAESVAKVVRDVYADRITGASSSRGQQQRQPSPEDFMRMLAQRGGGGNSRGGGGGGGAASTGEPTKIAIGVDEQSNSLVVAAPEPLFREVEELVRTLDQANVQKQDVLEVRTLKMTNPEVIQKALQSILGDQATVSTSSSSSSGNSSRTSSGGTSDQPSPADIQRRLEFFQRLRSGGGGGIPGGGSGRPGGGGPPGGGRPSGGSPRPPGR